jgi:hypothetical protein
MMATIFKRQYTQHLPKNAEIVERRGKKVVQWIDRGGQKHIDRLTTGTHGEPKILRESPMYFARYRDADGIEHIETTGCSDEQAARQVLANLQRRVEHMKAGILTAEQNRQANHADRPVPLHIAEYLEHLKAKTVRGRKVSAKHRKNVERHMKKLQNDAGLRVLNDITRGMMERWINRQESEGMAARTRNMYRATIVRFCNWCVENDRLAANPLARLCKADEHADRRRVRRALTEEEVARLLKAARLRPIAELGRPTIRKSIDETMGRRSWTRGELTFATLDAAYAEGMRLLARRSKRRTQLETLGRERELIYRVLVLTGLRKVSVR